DHLMRFRKRQVFNSDVTRLAAFTKLVVTIRVVCITHKFEVFINVFKNLRRSRDCLNTSDLGSGFTIRAVNDVQALHALSVERLNVVLFERLSSGRVTFQHRSEERTRNSSTEVVVIWKRQNGNVAAVWVRSQYTRHQAGFTRFLRSVEVFDGRP